MGHLKIPEDTAFAVYEIRSADPYEGVAIASVLGEVSTMAALADGPLVRMHSACLYGEVFLSNDCECGQQLQMAEERIVNAGAGILFYLHQEGRGAGLITKAQGYELKDKEGLGTDAAYARLGVPFDQRKYGHCARFLLDSGIKRVRLMSNNPRKIDALEDNGITVVREPLIVGVNDQNREYLRIKRGMGHLLPDDL